MTDTLEPGRSQPSAARGQPGAAEGCPLAADEMHDGPVYIGPSAYGWSSGTPGGSPNLSRVHRLPARVAGAVACWGVLGGAVWVHPALAVPVLVVVGGAALWDSRRPPPPLV